MYIKCMDVCCMSCHASDSWWWHVYVHSRNMVHIFPGLHSCEEIETIRLPVFDEKSPRKISVESFPILYPHRILWYLMDEVGIHVDDSEVTTYWRHLRSMSEPWACEHPASEHHIPLGIHGDAARLWTQYQVEKVVAIHMNIIHFRPRSTRHSRFLLFSCPREKLIKNRSLNLVWKRLVWSFNACFEGCNPSVGPSGGPLTGKHLERAGTPISKSGRRFALCELRGDWEWHRDVWRFTASWQGIKVCFRCDAVRKGDPGFIYHNNGPNCLWRDSEFDLDQFITHRLKDQQLCQLANMLVLFYSRPIFVFWSGHFHRIYVFFYPFMIYLRSLHQAKSDSL